VTVAYNKDPSPVKLNLGVGAYRTEVMLQWRCVSVLWFIIFVVATEKDWLFIDGLQEGKPLVLNVVRKAEQQLINDRFTSLSFGFYPLCVCVCLMMLNLVLCVNL